MNTTVPELSANTDPNKVLPETVQLTAATVNGWRRAGYRVSEERVASWLHVVARSSRDSAVYKVVGPSFDGQTAMYLGIRVA